MTTLSDIKNSSFKNSRRSFLRKLMISWTTITSLPFFYALVKYIYPPLKIEKLLNNLIAGNIDEIPINTAKVIRFNKRPVIVVHTSQDQFKAFLATCTHLACIVEYKGEERQFHCNCHGSIFDLNGKNIRGPAPTPLEPLKVSIRESSIIITA